jgi:hypothetical protein
MKTVARVNMMGLGCADGATTPPSLTLPLLPTLSQSPGSNPVVQDTGSMCAAVDWMANNQLSVLVIAAVAAWAFASVTKGGR